MFLLSYRWIEQAQPLQIPALAQIIDLAEVPYTIICQNQVLKPREGIMYFGDYLYPVIGKQYRFASFL